MIKILKKMKYLKRFNESSDYNLENLNSLVLDFIDQYQLSLQSEYMMQSKKHML